MLPSSDSRKCLKIIHSVWSKGSSNSLWALSSTSDDKCIIIIGFGKKRPLTSLLMPTFARASHMCNSTSSTCACRKEISHSYCAEWHVLILSIPSASFNKHIFPNDHEMLIDFHIEESYLRNTPFDSLLNFCILSWSNV